MKIIYGMLQKSSRDNVFSSMMEVMEKVIIQRR